MRELEFLLGLLKGRWRYMLLAALVGSFTVASGVGLLTISTYLIAAASLHPPLYTLQLGITGVRFFGFTRGFFRYGERILSHSLSLEILAKLRVEVFSSFYDSFPGKVSNPGGVFKRIIQDVENLEDFFVRNIYPVFVFLVVLLAGSLFFGLFDMGMSFKVSLLLFVAFVLFTGIAIAIGSSNGYGRAYEEYEKGVNDLVGGIADIQLMGVEEHFVRKIDRLSEEMEDRLSGKSRRESFLDFSVNAYLFTTSLVVLFTGWNLWKLGIVSGKSMLVITIGYIAMFEAIWPVVNAGLKLGEKLRSAGELMELGIEESKKSVGVEIGKDQWKSVAVQIDSVFFSYDNREIFRELTLNIAPGSKVAIVGPSGSGKSTLLSMISGLRRPMKGAVAVNGVPPHLFGDREREKICSLPQNPYIFYDTVRRNISLGRAVNENDIMRAIELAELRDFVEKLPHGLDTVIGPEGYRVSGGEARRVAIARIFPEECSLLLLDEPFEHLDPPTADRILKNIFEHFRESTIIVVTHHLSFLSRFDEVVVIRSGRVAERGRAEELLQRRGALYELFSFSDGFVRE